MIVIRNIFLGVLSLLLLLVPLAGRYFGSEVRPLEMATALEPQYFGFSILLLLIALLTRRRWVIFLAAVTAIFHGSLVIPWYFGKSPPSSGSEPFKVISFNLLHGNRRFDQTVEWVIKQEPQVAVFQEVTPPWPDELQKLRVAFPYHYRADELQMDVFSKLPILHPDFQKFGKIRGFIRFEVNVGEPVTVYATHTYAQTPFGMEGFRFHREHLVSGLPADVNKHWDTPIVVLGDLNATMWSPHYAALMQSTGLKNARQGFGICPSLGNEKNWKPWTAVPFDHCLVSRDIGVEWFGTGPFLGSDHLPIIAELRIPKKSQP